MKSKKTTAKPVSKRELRKRIDAHPATCTPLKLGELFVAQFEQRGRSLESMVRMALLTLDCTISEFARLRFLAATEYERASHSFREHVTEILRPIAPPERPMRKMASKRAKRKAAA